MDNSHVGNKAMASALLLYYQILSEDGITNDQTVYIDPDDFDGFSYLSVDVDDNLGIDDEFLKEAAVVHLLCDLNDMIIDYEDDFWLQPLVKRITNSFSQGLLSTIPETVSLFENIEKHESMDYVKYLEDLDNIYKKYVVDRFKRLTIDK